MKLWLHDSFLKWYCYSGGGDIIDIKDVNRPYQIWEHSKLLIDKSDDSFHLSDGISNLKRSYDRRLKLIESLYGFRSLDPTYKNKGYLEILENFGLVRPFIMKNLLLIRNDIEHNDAEPPSKERCKELVDVVWYFLKSTDPIVSCKRTEFHLEKTDLEGNRTQYWCSIDMKFETPAELIISGWFPEELLSNKEEDHSIELDISEIHNNEEWIKKGKHLDKKDTDLWISSETKININKHDYILRRLLSLTNHI